MALAGLSHGIGIVLSLALLGSAGSVSQPLTRGQSGYQVAEMQAELGVLGYDVGPVRGRVNSLLIRSAVDYETDFGLTAKEPFETQIAETLSMIGTVPINSGGALLLSVEDDLARLGLYHGTYSGDMNPGLESAIAAFQDEVSLPKTRTLTAATLQELAHYTAVRVTADHHWPYTAQPHDTLRLLAWAANLPLLGFARANDAHGSTVWVGQMIHWRTETPPQQPSSKISAHSRGSSSSTNQEKSTTPPVQRSKPSPPAVSKIGYNSAPVGPTSSTPTIAPGVLSNLKPLADLVMMNPRARAVESLLTAEEASNVTIDVAISGEWALLHQSLVKQLIAEGNELVLSGYASTNLNSLSSAAVLQELTWGKAALTRVAGTAPTFVMSNANPGTSVSQAAQKLGMVTMDANVIVDSHYVGAKALANLLMDHRNDVILVTGSTRFSSLFRDLAAHHFVFETLGQIWANQ